ncbi:MAG: hypothetical protein E7074_07630 [Bacteroidales bacterium]|jgi:hypothetical protein|nr:hypothetical protein [Bacteroidales bacterium]
MKKYLFIMLAAVSVAIVSCKPQPKPEKEVTFEISVSDVTAQEATVSVVPSDTSKLYYYSVIPSESAATFESMEAMADTLMLYLKKQIDMYAAYGYTRYFNELMDKGNASYTFDALSAQTSYTAFAFVADTVNLVHVGKVAVKAFTTAEVPQVNLMFEAARTDTAIWFLPNNDEITYLPIYVDADSLNGYTISEFYQGYWEYIEATYGMYYTLDDFVSEGSVYILYDKLEAGHNYIFAARAYTAGTWNSSLFQAQFTATVPNSAPAKINKMDFSKQLRMKKAQKYQPMNRDFKAAKIAK